MSGEKLNGHNKGARLCHIKKVASFDGYGFNLHAEKGKSGQYIGKVDEGSPAELAGLRQGDRILEVNGESIGDKTHKQVVELIKQNANETKLIVIDPEDDSIILSINSEAKQNADNSSNGKQDDNYSNHIPSIKKEREMNSTLNLSMTAAELRAKLAAKKKFDPKKEAMDFKQKFDIVQKL
ncbi:Na(+)/H(+) exchange regulatory cofactor NHE-RF2-like [Anthonomus grandis grandis]|uniref:Na(+)/H(+) exchange regulatory cofactor NHE-RF2-like n=1 Tax=Anthonomus grandis grandis TaxID=2921223 RepID=UPI0021654460|nr:Na(+)/H(+) exchange regulatory cofactor NHE-RF2-like [Anthonomus grandis grandis]